jgi:hypothetical protein
MVPFMRIAWIGVAGGEEAFEDGGLASVAADVAGVNSFRLPAWISRENVSYAEWSARYDPGPHRRRNARRVEVGRSLLIGPPWVSRGAAGLAAAGQSAVLGRCRGLWRSSSQTGPVTRSANRSTDERTR